LYTIHQRDRQTDTGRQQVPRLRASRGKVFCVCIPTVESGPTPKSEPKLLLNSRVMGLEKSRRTNLAEGRKVTNTLLSGSTSPDEYY